MDVEKIREYARAILALCEPEPIATPAIEFLHWGTTTKAYAAYPKATAFRDLKVCGVNLNLCGEGTLDDNEAALHKEIFGGPAALLTGHKIDERLVAPGRAAIYRECPVVVFNDEAKGDAARRNAEGIAKLRDTLGEIPPEMMVTHGPFALREQFDGPARWQGCTHASSWRYCYPNVETPEWQVTEGAQARATGLPTGYLQVQLIPGFEREDYTGPTAPRDSIIRAALYATLQRPRYVGYYGWWRVWTDPTAKATLAEAIARSRQLAAALPSRNWTRAKPEVVLVVDRPAGWGYLETYKMYQIGSALARAGIRYDTWNTAFGPVPDYVVRVDLNLADAPPGKEGVRVNGEYVDYDKRATWGRGDRYLDDPRYFLQHQAEAEADRVARAVVAKGATPLLAGGQAVCEVFEGPDGSRRIAVVNARMEYPYPIEERRCAGKSVAVAESVTLRDGRVVELEPFGFVVVKEQ